MGINRELQEAIREVTENMKETESFRLQFSKMIENYMDGMGSEAEISDVIDQIRLEEVSDEN